MIIKTDSNKYNIPLYNGINVLLENEYTEEIVSCLLSYFGSKKKTICSIYEQGEIIQPKEYDFIYIPEKENVLNDYHFKDKTILNSFVSEMVLNTPEMFLSIDRIRTNIDELLTDRGIYDLYRIMFHNLGINPEIALDDFSVSNLLEMLNIQSENLNYSQMMASLYNVLLFSKRGTSKIVYIDFPIDNSVLKWLDSLKELNEIVIINSKSLEEDLELNCIHALIPANKEEVCEEEMSSKDFRRLLYMSKPFILKNLAYQKEENIRFISNFKDNFATYLIKIA